MLCEQIGFFDGLCIGYQYCLITDTLENGEVIEFAKEDSVQYYYYDIEGNIQLWLPCSIMLAGNFSEGLAPAVNQERKLGFINKKGEWAIPPKYELMIAGAYPFPQVVIPYFQGGYAYIKSFKGYIDKTGKEYFSGKQMKDSYNFSH